jgi:tRNA pseudouridine55 synthase
MVLDRRTLGSIDEWLEQARTVGAIALIDKEETWTSFDCVAKVRNMSRIKRVGHAGTLDPLATGLLVLCFGKATKDIASLQDDIKVYDVDILLGATSTTDDRGGEVEQHVCEPADNDAVTNTLEQFLGVIQQTPPAFSAVRHQGSRGHGAQYHGCGSAVAARSVQNYVLKGYIHSIDR